MRAFSSANNNRKPITLKAAVGYRDIISGIALFFLVPALWIESKLIAIIMCIISLLGPVYSMTCVFLKQEEKDEMYREHIGIASDFALSITVLIFILAALFQKTISQYLRLDQVIFIGLGISDILRGIVFLFLEKVGD